MTPIGRRAYGPALSDKQTTPRAATSTPGRVEPIDRRRVPELLAGTLLDRIVTGALTPGEVIPTERELTQTFRVGRSSVREGLRILESRGLIAADGRGRFVVAEPTRPLHRGLELLLSLEAADFSELFEVRNILEVESAGLAADRRTEVDLRSLGEAVTEMKGSLDAADLYVEADLRFHVGIALATGNRITAHLMHAIRGLLERALVDIFRIAGSAESSVAQHQRILEAITASDSAAARRRMREHLTKVERDVRAALDGGERRAPSPPDGTPITARGGTR